MDFNISEHYSRVKMLNQKIDPRSAPDHVEMPDRKARELRARLILEEAMETIDALGVSVYYDYAELDDDHKIPFHHLRLEASHEPDLVEIADGCADLSVVTIGTLITCGIPDVDLLRIVDENNLMKFGPGSYRRPDGKLIKPSGHQPPDIRSLLFKLERNSNL